MEWRELIPSVVERPRCAIVGTFCMVLSLLYITLASQPQPEGFATKRRVWRPGTLFGVGWPSSTTPTIIPTNTNTTTASHPSVATGGMSGNAEHTRLPLGIPLRLFFNHKSNMLALPPRDTALAPHDALLRMNVVNTITVLRHSLGIPVDYQFWNDTDCLVGIESLSDLKFETADLKAAFQTTPTPTPTLPLTLPEGRIREGGAWSLQKRYLSVGAALAAWGKS